MGRRFLLILGILLVVPSAGMPARAQEGSGPPPSWARAGVSAGGTISNIPRISKNRRPMDRSPPWERPR
jgi:hypothetical protein